MKIIKRLVVAVFGGFITALLLSTIFSAATGGLLAPFCALSFPLQWLVAGIIGFSLLIQTRRKSMFAIAFF